MYYDEIDALKEEYNTQLEIKADARLEFTKNYVILSKLASQLSPLKNTACVENKINSLLSLEDEEMREIATNYFTLMEEKEVIFKNARDRIEYLNMSIREYQSRRKTERDLK